MKVSIEWIYPVQEYVIDCHPHEGAGTFPLTYTSFRNKVEWCLLVGTIRVGLSEVRIIDADIRGVAKVIVSGVIGCGN